MNPFITSSRAKIQVIELLYMCKYVSAYYCIYVLVYMCLVWRKRPLHMCVHHQVAARAKVRIRMLLDLWPRTTKYGSSYCYMCPHRARRAPVRRPSHTTTYVPSYCCVCPHSTICVSSYYLDMCANRARQARHTRRPKETSSTRSALPTSAFLASLCF